MNREAGRLNAPPPVYTLVHHAFTNEPVLPPPRVSSPPVPGIPRACWWTNSGLWGPPMPRRPEPAPYSPARCPSPIAPVSGRGSPAGCCCGLGSFPIAALDELYEAVNGMPWEDHLKVDGTLAIEATSTIRQGPLANVNTHFVEQRVKDAVVDRFRAQSGKAAGSGTGPPRRSHRRPSGAGGDHREPGPVRRRPASPRVPVGGRRSSAQGEPGGCHTRPGGVARHRRPGRRAAGPDVRLGDPARRGRSHGRRYRPRPAPAVLRLSQMGRLRPGDLDAAARRGRRAAHERGSLVCLASSAPTGMRARSDLPAPTRAERDWPDASSWKSAISRRSRRRPGRPRAWW